MLRCRGGIVPECSGNLCSTVTLPPPDWAMPRIVRPSPAKCSQADSPSCIGAVVVHHGIGCIGQRGPARELVVSVAAR